MTKCVFVLALAAFAGASLASDGKTIYSQTCAACHATGLGGAPKLTEKLAWPPRLAGGKSALVTSVVKGKGAMPPKAGNPSLSDGDIGVAIDYMLEQIGN